MQQSVTPCARSPAERGSAQRTLQRFASPSELEEALAPGTWTRGSRALAWREVSVEFDGPALRARLREERTAWLLGERWDRLDAEHLSAMAEPERAREVVAAQGDLWQALPLGEAVCVELAAVRRGDPRACARREGVLVGVMARRHNPNYWTLVTLPERDLAEVVLEFAAPLLERCGPSPSIDDARAAVGLAVAFWNASVLASKRWDRPRLTALNELKKHMRGRGASRDDAATFDLLTERWRAHWLDPRLVERWSYEPDAAGAPRLACTMALPDGVEVAVPPPIETRVAIHGKFLDEVQISLGANRFMSFPVHQHRGVIDEDGSATVHTKMSTAAQLFAEGRLPRIGGEPVELTLCGRTLRSMVLTALRCDDHLRDDLVALAFRPSQVDARR